MKSRWTDSLLVVFLSAAILFALLGNHLFHPNDYVFAFGGDPAILYYNMIYHTLYGSGWHLSNMNYPMGESLLMTDSQASLTFLLNKLNSFQFVRENIIGFSHAFHYVCFALAAMFMHRSFLKLGVNRWLSIVGALLVVFFSPQLYRIRAHFGLAYPIIFTSTIYCLVSFRLERKFKYAVLLSLILLFFGINNIYLLILSVGLCFFYLLFDFLFTRDWKGLHLMPFVILPLAIVFALIKLTSPEMDRLVIQWGYYPNRMTFEGMFYPFTSLIGTALGKVKMNIENVSALGLTNTLGLLVLILGFVFKFSRAKILSFLNQQRFAFSLFLSSLVLLVYASGIMESITEIIPAATMFKASGRFSWPFYYALSVLTILGINCLLKNTKKDNWRYLLFIPLMIWSGECFNYLHKHVVFKQYDTQYSPTALEKVQKQLDDAKIDMSSFQAIYGLPTMEAWNDKFHLKIPFHTEFNASRISMASGVPLISAMLSRIGLTQAGESIQLASHPWIEKTLLSKLDDRNILLVVGKESPLTEGEQFLIKKSKLLLDAKTFALYKLLPSDIRNIESPICQEAKKDYFFDGFEDIHSELSLTGKGALLVKSEKTLMELENLQNQARFDYSDMSVSIFVHSTNKKYGMPWIRAAQFDKSRNKIKEDFCDVAASKDFIDNWRRAEFTFEKKDETDSLSITLTSMNQDFVVDNFLLRSQSDTLCHYFSPDSSKYLVNNFLIKE